MGMLRMLRVLRTLGMLGVPGVRASLKRTVRMRTMMMLRGLR